MVDRINCIARYSKYCQGFFKCPDFTRDELADFLIELAERKDLQGWLLLPSNDHVVYTLAKHNERLEKVFKMTTPTLEVFESIYDKSRLLQLAQELHLPVPATEYLTTFTPDLANLKFPVIIKGKKGLSFYKKTGRKAVIASDMDELHRRLKELQQVIPLPETFTQEIIPFDGTNKTISFTAFCIEGEIRTYWMGVKLREHPLQFGTATFCESVYQKECLDQSMPLLKALKFTGVCEIEYLRDPRDGLFKLIEMNARTWLWVGLAVACGVNYPLLLYNYANGILSEYPLSYPSGIKWRNFWTDLFFSLLAVLKRRLTIEDYFSSVKKETIIDAVRDQNDPEPFRAMTWMLLRLARGR